MSRDEFMGRLIRLAEQCDEPTILRLCDMLETALEPGPDGVCSIEDFCSIKAETANDADVNEVRAIRDSALQLVNSGL